MDKNAHLKRPNTGEIGTGHAVTDEIENRDRDPNDPSYICSSMTEEMQKVPVLLSIESGVTARCIFRAPEKLHKINPEAYEPQIVSIGPYHHDKDRPRELQKARDKDRPLELREFQVHKWRILRSLLSRTQSQIDGYVKDIMPLEAFARECYSDQASVPPKEEFVQMLVLDGCFVIELLRAFHGLIEPDPIFTTPHYILLLSTDFLKLENQLPLPILQRLFDISQRPEDKKAGATLESLALELFNYWIQRPEGMFEKRDGQKCPHLLDLFRSTFLPMYEGESMKCGFHLFCLPFPILHSKKKKEKAEPTELNRSSLLFPCATKLRVAGIRFKPAKAHSFLQIKFRKGYLELPPLRIDDFSRSFMLNCIAFEQCYGGSSTQFIAYAIFIDSLINATKDVKLLIDAKVIENHLQDDATVTRFFNKLGSHIVCDVRKCYLSEEFKEVSEYYANNYNKMRLYSTSFKDRYLSSPWAFIGLLVGFVLLALTILQTFYTIFPYYHPR